MVRVAYVLSMYAKVLGMEVRMSLARFDYGHSWPDKDFTSKQARKLSTIYLCYLKVW